MILSLYLLDHIFKRFKMTLSSIRYKENIKPIQTETESIRALQPVEFNYKHDARKDKIYGLIAEDVHANIPSLVVRDNEGEILTVKYQELPVLLLNEIQKLYTRIERLESLLNIK